jgi:hypothetical protein
MYIGDGGRMPVECVASLHDHNHSNPASDWKLYNHRQPDQQKLDQLSVAFVTLAGASLSAWQRLRVNFTLPA